MEKETKQERDTPNILKERINLKPCEYPQFKDFTKAINHAFWLVDEFNFDQDIQDFKVILSEVEQEAVKRSMLAISQVEVSVKDFYGQVVSRRFPKPEIKSMATTFAENEVRHEDAYSELLEKLGLNEEFEKINDIPELRDRVKYLSKYKEYQNADDIEEFIKALILFSIYIEGCSLMGQFLILQSYKKHTNCLKGICNVVEATSVEENLHSLGASALINELKKEAPEIFTPALRKLIITQTEKALKAEIKVVEWIFEKGELEFLSKNDVIEFLKNRFNLCLQEIDFDPIFEVNEDIQEKTEWFEVKLRTDASNDFFHNKSTSYTKCTQSFDAEDIF